MRVIETDVYTGITEQIDIKNGHTQIKTVQNIDDTLDVNNADRNNSGAGWKGEMHHVARIPMLMIQQWNNELKSEGANDTNIMSANNKKRFIAKLNDYNFSKLRTKTGRI